jgi:2-polyprenyl-3-methyl-5-hydroxy-6-metoxy-1,4-benzoquinol methylase
MSTVQQPKNTDGERWDVIAKQYAEWLEGEIGTRGRAFTTLVTKHMLATIGDMQDKDILDLGCGEGYLARALKLRGARVWGIDVAPAMIELARAKDPHRSIDYIVGDITQKLPYASDRFDLVICNMVLMDIEHITFTVQEVARVLKYSARFIFSIVHPCFFDALGQWIDLGTPHPGFRFKARYTEKVKYMKRLVGLSSEGMVVHYNRPIQDYIKPLLENGLCIADFLETSFSREYLETVKLFEELLHYYMTANNLIVGAIKLS